MTVTKKLLLFAGITAVALMFNALTAEPAKHAGSYVGGLKTASNWPTGSQSISTPSAD